MLPLNFAFSLQTVALRHLGAVDSKQHDTVTTPNSSRTHCRQYARVLQLQSLATVPVSLVHLGCGERWSGHNGAIFCHQPSCRWVQPDVRDCLLFSRSLLTY